MSITVTSQQESSELGALVSDPVDVLSTMCPNMCLCIQVIDDQVDALAANAAKALGSLWGGLNTVAKTSWGFTAAITTKVRG